MSRLALLLLVFGGLALAAPAAAGPPTVRTNRDAPHVLPLPASDDVFHFAIYGDRTGGPPEGLDVLREAVRATNLLGPDLVMTVGDLVQGYNRTGAWIREMRAFKAVMNGLEMAWYPVPGNHDIYWRPPPTPPGHHEQDYEKHFGPLWYWFPHKNAAFFVLYSDEGDPKTNRKGWKDPKTNRFSDAQLAWLEQALEDAADKDHVFLFLHHPRWIEANYRGSNWDAVHALLKKAGNVSAVFGGHIHRQRYDGEKDGIAYFTLATTGGGIPFNLPGTGHLHHMNLVSVRKSGITVATIPIGAVLDPRDMTPGHLEEIDRLRGRIIDGGSSVLTFDARGFGEGTYRLRVRNPSKRPIEVDLRIESPDPAWRFAPEHAHLKLAPEQATSVDLAWARRPVEGLLRFRFPKVVAQVDYLGSTMRVALPEQIVEMAWGLTDVPEEVFGDERENGALALDGDGASLSVDARRFRLPDGPFTVEGRLRADDLQGRRALLAKTEKSEFGLFVTDGRPSFHVWLGKGYVTAQAPKVLLETGRWHDLAGVYDGKQVRLYVDGQLVASADGTGRRKTNGLPFLIGADPDKNGRATASIQGLVDEVRVSTVARYTTSEYPILPRLAPDDDTLLLLHLDGPIGPFAPDHSARGLHALARGKVRYRLTQDD